MKTLARIGSVLSFGFFFIAGLIMLSLPSGPDRPVITVLALCFFGGASFLGSILWLMGERCR